MQQSIKRKFNRNLCAVAFVALIALTAAGCSGTLFGTTALDKPATVNKDSQNLALGGYDAVAYFKENNPRQGKSEFVADYDGAKWQFATAENRNAFSREPAKYAPQYGGYCAWAVSQGYTADTDPNTGKVVDGKLYLNYNPDVAKKWNENIPKYIRDGDDNWRNLAGNAEKARQDKK